jgi:alpha-tubulin suppressor-like RCC1 family protein
MHRLTRQILRPFLFALLPLFLAACGSGDDSDTDVSTYELISSTVYGEHSVVIDQDETKAWGANGYGQLGIGGKLNQSTPKVVAPKVVGEAFSSVSIGGAHTVALNTAAGGTVSAWGHNSSGQLGDGTLVTKTSPVPVVTSLVGPDLTGVKAIAAGGKHTLAINADDTVLAWGSNLTGQLGDGTLVSKSVPVKVVNKTDGLPLGGITAIAAGGDFSLALKSDGTVWAWGNNSKGQLGNNTLVASSSSVQVVMPNVDEKPDDLNDDTLPLSGIIAIAAGGSHALALKNDGTIYAWGYNEFGQLGNGTITSSKVAVTVVKHADLVATVPTAISAGLDHSVAIIGGKVYAWGYNYYGQLGNGAVLQSYSPVKSLEKQVLKLDGTDLPDIVEIIATGHHCIARDISGTVWTWGRNTHGQLGDGTSLSRSKAKEIIIVAPAT